VIKDEKVKTKPPAKKLDVKVIKPAKSLDVKVIKYIPAVKKASKPEEKIEKKTVTKPAPVIKDVGQPLVQ